MDKTFINDMIKTEYTCSITMKRVSAVTSQDVFLLKKLCLHRTHFKTMICQKQRIMLVLLSSTTYGSELGPVLYITEMNHESPTFVYSREHAIELEIQSIAIFPCYPFSLN